MNRTNQAILDELYISYNISDEFYNYLKKLSDSEFEKSRGIIVDFLGLSIEGNSVIGIEPLTEESLLNDPQKLSRVLKANGLNSANYYSRVKLGWSRLDAATTPKAKLKGRKVTDHLGNEFDSVSAMCTFHCVENDLYYKRRKSGASLEEALTSKYFKKN